MKWNPQQQPQKIKLLFINFRDKNFFLSTWLNFPFFNIIIIIIAICKIGEKRKDKLKY